MANQPEYTIALAGNPNSGKTTIFNRLTGSNQSTGNWPGVTVERKEGHFRFADKTIRIIDLPGIYSLTSYSLDEKLPGTSWLKGNRTWWSLWSMLTTWNVISTWFCSSWN
ncbi:50S ribosome-binding GTPase [bacterium]|nr:50S ribosome-binding GTPase [bacterium]